jgi:2-amino-4-hydroxy-6-hydroxymethyldihydropteridine diphosphokinase
MSAAGVTAFVGLGSNLEQPERQVRDALRELRDLPDTRLLSQSPLYRSSPLGPGDQPDYVNAVAMLDTALDAHVLLDRLQALERAHGRVRNRHWGPRTLDLDLLLYDDQRIDSVRLSVPHPQMHERAFVLVPLHDIAPDLYLPGVGALADLIRRMPLHGLQPLPVDADA